MFPVELKVIAFEYEGQKFDQSLCRWVLDFSFLPNFLADLDQTPHNEMSDLGLHCLHLI